MNWKKTPATTDAIAHGISTAMKSRAWPRNARLSTSAVISASGSVTAVVIAAKNSVRGIASRISLSIGQPDEVVVQPDEPDHVVLAELDPVEAQPEHRQGGRQDDQRDEDQARDRDEERELALTQAVEAARHPASSATERGTSDGHARPASSCSPPGTRMIAVGPADCQSPRCGGARRCGAVSVCPIEPPDEGLVDLDAEARDRSGS